MMFWIRIYIHTLSHASDLTKSAPNLHFCSIKPNVNISKQKSRRRKIFQNIQQIWLHNHRAKNQNVNHVGISRCLNLYLQVRVRKYISKYTYIFSLMRNDFYIYPQLFNFPSQNTMYFSNEMIRKSQPRYIFKLCIVHEKLWSLSIIGVTFSVTL